MVNKGVVSSEKSVMEDALDSVTAFQHFQDKGIWFFSLRDALWTT